MDFKWRFYSVSTIWCNEICQNKIQLSFSESKYLAVVFITNRTQVKNLDKMSRWIMPEV